MQNSQKIIKYLQSHVLVIRFYQVNILLIASNQSGLCRSIRAIYILLVIYSLNLDLANKCVPLKISTAPLAVH